MTQLPPGTIVRLKSGGPKMTVINRATEGYFCQYFDRIGQCHTSYFLADNLVPEPA